jgi:hypothetical protein
VVSDASRWFGTSYTLLNNNFFFFAAQDNKWPLFSQNTQLYNCLLWNLTEMDIKWWHILFSKFLIIISLTVVYSKFQGDFCDIIFIKYRLFVGAKIISEKTVYSKVSFNAFYR